MVYTLFGRALKGDMAKNDDAFRAFASFILKKNVNLRTFVRLVPGHACRSCFRQDGRPFPGRFLPYGGYCLYRYE